MLSSKKRLDNAYKEAKVIDFDDDSKFILFSDCHRGDNSFADEIENGEISLIKWQIATREDGTLQIVRVLLEDPRKLMDYKTS